jgi:outer membrane protein assembly factor BamD
MVWNRTWLVRVTIALVVGTLLTSCGFRRKKYENPITTDTQQPDKILFDKAVKDIERGRYEVARLTLNTLINTYDTSEYLAKAKLAIADSWFREGGSHGLAQAEAEYKDFILFYPAMEEASESQYRICDIHYRQMEKPDRDTNHALRAELECRQLLVQFPNTKYAPMAEQRLRNIQEVLAEGEMRVASFYHNKGSHPAAVNRFKVVDQYPLYSAADEALWLQGDSYTRMGPRFREKAGESYARIVRDYPLSAYADNAKRRLTEMEMEIPEADPVALNRMRYELENQNKPGVMSHAFGIFRRGPDTRMAAKSGTPAMEPMRPPIPESVPSPTAAEGFTGDVTVAPVTDPTALDTQPDARQAAPAGQGGGNGQVQPGTTPAQQPLPANQQPRQKQKQEKPKKGDKKESSAKEVPATGHIQK